MDLSEQLSNPAAPLSRMLKNVRSPAHGAKFRPDIPKPPVRRLTGPEEELIVRRYRDGLLQRELAAELGIHQATVSQALARHGARRSQGLGDAQIQEAVERYGSGQSLATIGAVFGADPGTVRRRLLEQGVVMRSTSGAPR